MSIFAIVLVTFYFILLLNMWRLTFRAFSKWWRVRHSKDKVKRSYAFDNFFQGITLTIFATFMFIAIAYENL